MTYNPYTPIWSKYRPAILKLMVDSAESPQQYRFSGHEFKGANPKEKRGFTFTLQAQKGKAVNNIKGSEIAQGLLSVLQQSPKANELMENTTYEFSLDKHFVLHIRKEEASNAAESDDAATDTAKVDIESTSE